MEDIARALATHPPFSQLAQAQLLKIAGTISIEYFAANHDILSAGGPPAQFLYIIQRGSVSLLRDDSGEVQVFDTLGIGEAFGHPSLISSQSPAVTVRTREEVLAYLLPAELFHELRTASLPFAQFFAASSIERLGYALESRHIEATPGLFQMRLSDLVHRELIMIAPTATVRTAAQMMRDQHVSCLVVSHDPPSILTDRDLRNRVLADGLSDTTPVAQVMTTPALTLPADSLVFEGLLVMLERGVHHMPIIEQKRVIGIVTHTDILRQQNRSPLLLPRQLQRAKTVVELRRYTDQVTETVIALLDQGARVSDIGRVVAIAHDALLTRLLQDAERELGPPPCPFAWIVLGSEGRYEQTMRTDQDNALIYADDAPPDADDYFHRYAEFVVNRLVDCGFPRCPGNVMATNPEWRQPLSVWQYYFYRWIDLPEEEALLRVAIFFDFRQVYGTLDADGALRTIIRRAKDNQVFLGRLARTTLRQPAPVGIFHQLLLERQGKQKDLIDLKYRGTAMLVDLARLFALEAACPATNSLARLRLAAEKSTLSRSGAEELAAAFELLSLLRLRHQRRQLERNEMPTNLVSLSELSQIEQRELKESLLAIAKTQRGVEFAFQTGRMA